MCSFESHSKSEYDDTVGFILCTRKWYQYSEEYEVSFLSISSLRVSTWRVSTAQVSLLQCMSLLFVDWRATETRNHHIHKFRRLPNLTSTWRRVNPCASILLHQGTAQMGIRPSVPSVRMLTGGSGGSGRKSGVGAKSASNSTTASPTPVQNEATKYILHEEWLADVCGVSRRRWVGVGIKWSGREARLERRLTVQKYGRSGIWFWKLEWR